MEWALNIPFFWALVSECLPGRKAYVIRQSPENLCIHRKMFPWANWIFCIMKSALKGVSRFLCVCQSPSCSSVLPAWKFPSLKWCFSFPCAYLYVHMFTPFSLFGWLNTRVARSWNANACYWWSKWMLKDVENKRRKRKSKWKIWCRTERKSIHSGLARRYTKYAKEIFFLPRKFYNVLHVPNIYLMLVLWCLWPVRWHYMKWNWHRFSQAFGSTYLFNIYCHSLQFVVRPIDFRRT